MRRADRLLQIIQLLRRAGGPIAASQMASELEVSVRTLYRDIVSLEASGVPVRGEAGVGYVLEDGYDMPPLMFTASELEAIMLGARLLDGRLDDALSMAAKDVVAKIAAVVPKPLAEALIDTPIFAPMLVAAEKHKVDIADIRTALRQENQVRLHYRDLSGKETERIIWPVLLSLFDQATVLAAWCTTREDFRTFRTDGIIRFERLEAKLPVPRKTLYARWKRTKVASYRNADFVREKGGRLHGI